MSSWLSISLPNPFRSDEDQAPSPDHSPTAGLRDDLSVLGATIGRQLRGVAAFLAPPPTAVISESSSSAAVAEASSDTLLGIKNDLVEISGSFKSSLSLLSTNKAVSEISRLASNLWQFESRGNDVEGDEDGGADYEVAGITGEVLDFVHEISFRPELWTDFPLSLENGFEMSDAQKVHASTAEHLVPSLEALRHKICSFLSEKNFWMIYFVLLLPGLQEHDAKILSTPKIVEVREILLQKLQNKRNASVETSENSHAVNLSANNVEVSDSSQGKVLAASVNAEQRVKSDQEKTEQSPEEEDDGCASSIEVQKPPESGEDVSFSHLEDDDYDLFGGLSRLKPVSPTGSNEWVRLQASSGTQGAEQKAGSTPQEKDSEGEDSFDWLTIDEVDLTIW
ncbi:uncharacterized protein LOC127795267 [Diospyros lotus]|uniref:uncharacterized protein LOC127795267 n=1 Tax=Diospyros lotus TaxID=55363 RepID=UPI0022539EDA|nr:uncharacterized protein LOC127795267 [Diospyros lotus]